MNVSRGNETSSVTERREGAHAAADQAPLWSLRTELLVSASGSEDSQS